jgi:serine/threonine protein kinase
VTKTTHPGLVIAGRYRVMDTLGSGGMGAVYRAVDRQTGEMVALKVIKPSLVSGEGDAASDGALRGELEARFRREAELGALRSDHLVRVLDHGDDEGLLYIAMELLDGVTLKQRLLGGALEVPAALRMARDVVDGLVVAHAAGVVHRDVKPANIMLVADPRPGRGGERAVLVDFGIARTVDAGATMTATGQVIGTAGYIAPEVALGGRKHDARADLYAVGVVLYEALVGAPPFVGANAMSIVARQANEDPLPPRARQPNVPDAVDDLVLRLIDRRPARRPADAPVVLAAIGALLAGQRPRDLSVEGEPLLEGNEYIQFTFDPLARIARFKRTAVPYPSPEDVGHAFTLAREAFPVAERKEKALLMDIRDGPLRTDPRFTAIVAAESHGLQAGWRRVAWLVRTEEGVRQLDMLRQRGGHQNRRVFRDEDAALTYLLGLDD